MDLKEFEVFFEKELNKNQLAVSKESFEKYEKCIRMEYKD